MGQLSTRGGAYWRNKIKAKRCCWPNAIAANKRRYGRACRWQATGAFSRRAHSDLLQNDEFKAEPMSELLSSVSEHLLAPGGVTIESLQTVLGDLAGPGIDAADL